MCLDLIPLTLVTWLQLKHTITRTQDVLHWRKVVVPLLVTWPVAVFRFIFYVYVCFTALVVCSQCLIVVLWEGCCRGLNSGIEAVSQSVCSEFYCPETSTRWQQVKQGVAWLFVVSDCAVSFLLKLVGIDGVQPRELHPDNALGCCHHTVQLAYHTVTQFIRIQTNIQHIHNVIPLH